MVFGFSSGLALVKSLEALFITSLFCWVMETAILLISMAKLDSSRLFEMSPTIPEISFNSSLSESSIMGTNPLDLLASTALVELGANLNENCLAG